MERRSVSFPPDIWKRIKEIAAARPHHTENAIIIDLVIAGLEATTVEMTGRNQHGKKVTEKLTIRGRRK